MEQKDIPLRQKLFPFGSFEVLFNLENAPLMNIYGDHESFRQPDVSIYGQFTKPFELTFTHPTQTVGVSFHPWTAPMAFRDSGDLFTNRCIDGTHVRVDLCQIGALRAARTDEQVACVLDTILRKLLDQSTVDHVVADIVSRIHSGMTCPQVRDHVESLGLSRRRIEQKFREVTGLPMREYTKKFRFFKVVRKLGVNRHEDLTMLGLEAGYYDQSHFIRHFKQFTGMTPTQFRSDQTPLKSFFSSLIQQYA